MYPTYPRPWEIITDPFAPINPITQESFNYAISEILHALTETNTAMAEITTAMARQQEVLNFFMILGGLILALFIVMVFAAGFKVR